MFVVLEDLTPSTESYDSFRPVSSAEDGPIWRKEVFQKLDVKSKKKLSVLFPGLLGGNEEGGEHEKKRGKTPKYSNIHRQATVHIGGGGGGLGEWGKF